MTSKLKKAARRTAVLLTVCTIAASLGGAARATIFVDDDSDTVPTLGFWDGPK